jgi:hypothetical protein
MGYRKPPRGPPEPEDHQNTQNLRILVRPGDSEVPRTSPPPIKRRANPGSCRPLLLDDQSAGDGAVSTRGIALFSGTYLAVPAKRLKSTVRGTTVARLLVPIITLFVALFLFVAAKRLGLARRRTTIARYVVAVVAHLHELTTGVLVADAIAAIFPTARGRTTIAVQIVVVIALLTRLALSITAHSSEETLRRAARAGNSILRTEITLFPLVVDGVAAGRHGAIDATWAAQYGRRIAGFTGVEQSVSAAFKGTRVRAAVSVAQFTHRVANAHALGVQRTDLSICALFTVVAFFARF